MLKSTSLTLIQETRAKVDVDIEHNNTIKVDFSQMSKVPLIVHNHYNQCACGAIYIEDEIGAGDINPMKKKPVSGSSKHSIVSSTQSMSGMSSMENTLKPWFCRFCKKVNESQNIYIAPNNSKFILQNKIQRDLMPPILLFLIDHSGSMGETLSMGESNAKQKGKKTLCSQIIEMIQKSSYYQKNSFRDKEFRQSYEYHIQQYKKQKEQKDRNKKQTPSDDKNKIFYSKITFFMSVIEDYLSRISKENQNQDFRVGFIFFSQCLFIMKPAKQRYVPVLSSKTNTHKFQFPFQQQTADFNNLEEIYNEGKKYERFFGDSRLKKLDMSKLQVQHIKAEGQTALGPALALALGITSVHDVGSRIILVSDSMPNIGILSNANEEENDLAYSYFENIMKTRKLTLGVLNWVDDSIANQKYLKKKTLQMSLREQFHKFLSRNPENIKQITIDFSVSFDQVGKLDMAKKSIGNLLSRGYLGEALQINIFNDNERVKLNKFKYDSLDFRFIKFLNLKSKNWIQLQTVKVKEMDFLFPIITQIVVTYQDIFTKQKYLFMSYTKQKLIKIKTQEDKFEFLEKGDSSNIQQLIDLANISKFDRENAIPESICSRMSDLKNIEVEKMNIYYPKVDVRACQSLNKLVQIENRNMFNQEDQDQYL